MSDDPLLTTEWLAAHLDEPDVRVIDASYRMPAMRPPTALEEYTARHIPGAAFFDIDEIAERSNPLPHMLPSPLQFARATGFLGIENNHLVIAYDRGDYMGAPRAWWMFRVFGHQRVKVLDGGLKKWIADGYKVDAGTVSPGQRVYHAYLDESGVRHRNQLVANLASGAEQIVDARARGRFEGTVAEPWPGRRSGRIPGSLNVPFTDLINPDGTMKAAAELRAILSGANVDLQRPIVTTCGSGVTAATVTLALARLGIDNTALYDGSWAEWGLPEGPPIATGPA